MQPLRLVKRVTSELKWTSQTRRAEGVSRKWGLEVHVVRIPNQRLKPCF